jgi:hypothetical protein
VAFVHRFGSYLNSHVHFHVLVTDGVFSGDDDAEAVFHPAVDLDPDDFLAVQMKMRHRGLRWLHRHGHLDSVAIHTLDAPDHAGGLVGRRFGDDPRLGPAWFRAAGAVLRPSATEPGAAGTGR